MKNKIDDLRNHLFATLEALRDEDDPMDIERAKAVAQVAQVLVDSAKVENEFIKLTGANGSGFIPDAMQDPVALTTRPGQPRLVRKT